MRIIGLHIENFMKLIAVDIQPDGSTVWITGKNEQGKTSILDAIWSALVGGRAAKKITKPIREGKERAEIRLDLGDFIVTRTFTADGKTRLKVENNEGATYKSPQALLDGFVGRLSFDPLAFANLPEKEQAATLREMTGIDTTELDERREGHYGARTAYNRRAKEYADKLKGRPEPPADLPFEEIKMADILADMEKAEAEKRANDGLRAELERQLAGIINYEEQLAGIQAEIDSLKARIPSLEGSRNLQFSAAEELEIKVKSLADPDIDAIKARLEAADQTNQQIRDGQQFRELKNELDDALTSASLCSENIKIIDEEKAEMIRKADLPIDGLAFDDSGVTYKGIPFKQASSAEALCVSLAMAMALNPKLRVIRITDGSLLDSDNLALIEQMADKKDFQVWIERVVDEPGAVGFYIEDGQVKGENT